MPGVLHALLHSLDINW